VEPKRVLIVVGKMHFGGIETMIMNFYRNIDRSKVQFDFLLNYEEPGVFDDEIRQLGGRIYIMPRLFFKNTFKYIKALFKFFNEHKEYEVVHGHLTSIGFVYLTIAKLCGVKTAVIHAHYTSVDNTIKGFSEKITRLPLRFCADYYFACSNAAGRFVYGKNMLKKPNYRVILNGVIVDNFIFNKEIRDEKRKELNIEDKFVIANIGRFELQKNHVFLIDIFSEIYRKDKNAVLLLIGKGSLEDGIREKVKKLGLEGAVMFVGLRSDINKLMQAFDIFLLPSHYEGLPVVGVEAQTAGLKCFFSDAITTETDITGSCEFITLNNSAEFWADEILKYKDGYERKNTEAYIEKAGYDIKKQAKWLENFYLDCMK